jgi:hypothetical protein
VDLARSDRRQVERLLRGGAHHATRSGQLLDISSNRLTYQANAYYSEQIKTFKEEES